MSMCRAYILRALPFKENQKLLYLLTEHHGFIHAIARLASGKKKTASQACLQLFQPLFVQWQGQHSLKRLTHYEADTVALPLQGLALFCGFYVNELCLRALPQEQGVPSVFQGYHKSLLSLARGLEIRLALRYFEAMLLVELGALPDLTKDINNQPVKPDVHYALTPSGFQQGRGTQFSGSMLLQLHHQRLDAEHLPQAKNLLQQLLKPLIGYRPLASRQLLQQYQLTE